MDRDRPITGGGSTRQEMCVNFLFYYPRVKDFSFCDNTFFKPSWKMIDKLFSKVNIPPSTKYWIPLDRWPIHWTDEVANELRKYQNELDTLIPGCWGKRIYSRADATGPLPNRRAPRPRITEPLPPKKTCPIRSESEGSLALNLTEPPPHEKTSPNQLASGADMNASFALFFGILNVVIQALSDAI
ncbi:unnamed protein product [Porites evermanni]|uniref:Copper type II ascorbate-dependent monooxygenase C-terminal domain-containing protein n=2 Tax=Porites TaxID=46719 RepID=A0ABN8QU04_9CNID|nr:unnamed protein product [Porites evermanni]